MGPSSLNYFLTSFVIFREMHKDMHIDIQKYTGIPCFACLNMHEFQLPWFKGVTTVSQQFGPNLGYTKIY